MTVTEDIIELEHKYVLQTYKRPDFVLESGEGVWLYDSDGREYLDGGSGIAVNALGYQNQAIIAALRQAADSLIHVSNLYHTAPQALLARDLCENSFADRVFFCNSGAEANEGALKFARKWARTQGHTDKTGIVAFTGSFHGRTMGALACTATEKYRKPFEPLIGDVSFAQFNDLDSARQAITDKTCAVMIEPVQGEGGVTPADPDFLTGLRQICDETGALLIFDEIQCGLGRTGTLWAYEGYHVTPDIMTLAKPLAGGLPIGAILLTQTVADALGPGDHGSTFAGGPLICTVAQTLLPHIGWAGGAPVPLLTGLVVTYALRAPAGLALFAAMAAGLFQDSVSLMPLGYTSFCFSLCVLVIHRERELMISDSWFTHLVLGALAGFAVNLLTGIFLLVSGLAAFSPGYFLNRLVGGALLAALMVPILYTVIQQLEGHLGLAPDVEGLS